VSIFDGDHQLRRRLVDVALAVVFRREKATEGAAYGLPGQTHDHAEVAGPAPIPVITHDLGVQQDQQPRPAITVGIPCQGTIDRLAQEFEVVGHSRPDLVALSRKPFTWDFS